MTPPNDMNDRLRDLLDHHEIRKLLSLYCHGCDRGDGPMMAGVYAEESWDNHGRYKGPGREFTQSVMKSFADDGFVCSHLLGQSLINVSGDVAGAETYFLATILQKEEKAGEILTLLGGRYIDTLRREQDGWRIAKRVCVRDWSRTLDIKEDRLKHDNFVSGELSGQDPSYDVLGFRHPGLRSWLDRL